MRFPGPSIPALPQPNCRCFVEPVWPPQHLEARRLIAFIKRWRVQMAERLIADFIFQFPEVDARRRPR
jgi:hypothetical protein